MSSVDAAHPHVTQVIHIIDNPDTPPPSQSTPLPSGADDPATAPPQPIASTSSAGYAQNSYQEQTEPATNTETLGDGRTSDADKMFQSTLDGATLDEQSVHSEGEAGDTSDGSITLMLANGVEQGEHGVGVDDGRQWEVDDSNDLKRVKVYELIGARWVDQGTAFCFGDFQDGEALLIARAEANYDHIILTTSIKPTDVYQRQQETLIVWTEPDGVDYALSFQDPEGCTEVWNFIQEVQRHMAIPDPSLSSSPQLGESFGVSLFRSGRLPPPALGNIAEIERMIKTSTRLQVSKERVCEFIQTEEYIKSLIDVMQHAEELESLDNLHALCSCMQTILMLNDHSMYEHILDDENFLGVVGMLEYDPEFPFHKANYREFLQGTAHYHQPIPIRDEIIQKKVHHTYRLLFLKDVVLARAIDDSTFNVLNSCIIFNQIDIINHVQNDQAFLREVVGMFMDDDLLERLGMGFAAGAVGAIKGKEVEKEKVATLVDSADGSDNRMDVDPPVVPDDPHSVRRREVVLLIQQLCVMGKNVQLPARMQLFRTLTDRGILFAVQWALGQSEDIEEGKHMIAAAGEILTALLDHDLNGVRGHIVKQLSVFEKEAGSSRKLSGDKDKDTVLMLLCRMLVRSRDMAVQSQVGEALRLLMEIPTGDDPHPLVGAKVFQRPKDDPATEKFLDYFYKHCVEILFKPFFDVPEFSRMTETTLPLSRERTNLLLHLCELLSGFALQHSFRSHFYLLSTNIATRIASLLSTKDKHLRLAAFRFFRTLLRLNNRNLFLHMLKTDVFKPILDLTIQESKRDNLLSSSCQEFFEQIRRVNIKELVQHCMTKHEDKIKLLAESSLGGPRFKGFIRRYEMNIEPPPKEEEKVEKPAANGTRRWGQGRLMETEEEEYFNADDDEDEILPVLTSPGAAAAAAAASGTALARTTNALKRKRARGSSIPRPSKTPLIVASQRTTPMATTSLPTPPPPLSGLVDYSDEDDSTGESSAPPGLLPGGIPTMPSSNMPASPRLAHRQILSKAPPVVPMVVSTSEDEEDLLLESLVAKSTLLASSSSLPLLTSSLSPKPGEMSIVGPGSAVGSGPPGPGLKRRREDDDDELLVLANKSKRQSVSGGSSLGKEKEKERAEGGAGGLGGMGHGVGGGSGNGNSNHSGGDGGRGGVGTGARGNEGETGPKKIKLKLSSSAAVTPAPPSTGVKDGDTG